MDMPALAQEIAQELSLGLWEDDLIGREIGTADDVSDAIERIECVRQDAVDALISLHKAAADERNRAFAKRRRSAV